MANVAVITARGGSKRIPRKNIRDFCGKPIIAYSIDAALKSEIFDEIMVSTDDKEIAKISEKYGAHVPFFRSAETSDDYATTRDVLNEVINNYKSQNIEFDFLCCIYPTAPFVTAERLKEGYQTIIRNRSDSLEAVVKYDYPPQRGYVMDEKGYVKYCYPEYKFCRSQDLEPIYHDAGQFYWYNIKKCFELDNNHYSSSAIVLSDLEVQDIDNESDWEIAEIKYKLLNKLYN